MGNGRQYITFPFYHSFFLLTLLPYLGGGCRSCQENWLQSVSSGAAGESAPAPGAPPSRLFLRLWRRPGRAVSLTFSLSSMLCFALSSIRFHRGFTGFSDGLSRVLLRVCWRAGCARRGAAPHLSSQRPLQPPLPASGYRRLIQSDKISIL